MMSCSSGGNLGQTIDLATVWCATSAPIRFKANTITTLNRNEIEAVVAHNRYGSDKCGWKA